MYVHIVYAMLTLMLFFTFNRSCTALRGLNLKIKNHLKEMRKKSKSLLVQKEKNSKHY